MSRSFELDGPERFVTGAIGEPGQRVFYVQVAGGDITVSLKVEKTQVAALAQYVAELLADLPPVADHELPVDIDLAEPVEPEWVVGTIGVAIDEGRDRLIVTFQELLPDVGDEELGDAGALAVVAISRPQAMAFVRRAAQLVAAGRPPCMLCGRPIDAEGHVCIKTNGHLR